MPGLLARVELDAARGEVGLERDVGCAREDRAVEGGDHLERPFHEDGDPVAGVHQIRGPCQIDGGLSLRMRARLERHVLAQRHIAGGVVLVIQNVGEAAPRHRLVEGRLGGAFERLIRERKNVRA